MEESGVNRPDHLLFLRWERWRLKGREMTKSIKRQNGQEEGIGGGGGGGGGGAEACRVQMQGGKAHERNQNVVL